MKLISKKLNKTHLNAKMKSLIRSYIYSFCILWSHVYSYSISKKLATVKNFMYTAWISREFKKIDKSSLIGFPIDLHGGKYISIGVKSSIGKRAVLTAWDNSGSETLIPQIIIGNNVSIGEDSHITAINRIQIGNNVLMGKKITITDNSHGKCELELLSFPPSVRPLFSSGFVIIEEGVWIGDKVTILPNVTIGKNAIIGANAVITKNVLANSVVGGVPANVIKLIK